MWDIVHPDRRNLTAIRGYVRMGGLPDNPRTDPQDRAWFGPHDRLFTEEESVAVDFKPGPDYGNYSSHFLCVVCRDLLTRPGSMVLGVGRRGGPGRAGRGPDLGADVEQVDEGGLGQGQARSELALRVT